MYERKLYDVFVYPYSSSKERRKIIEENEGKYTDLENCIMYVKKVKEDELTPLDIEGGVKNGKKAAWTY